MSFFLSSFLKAQAILAAAAMALTLAFNVEHADSGDEALPVELAEFLSMPCGDAVVACTQPR